MERTVTTKHTITTLSSLECELSEAERVSVREKVSCYWQAVGLSDPQWITLLTEECLAYAEQRVGRRTAEEIIRRALKEARRRLDHALSQALHLPASHDPHPISAARAAWLLNKEQFPLERLLSHSKPHDALIKQFSTTVPCATPPETPLSMTEASLKFWLFSSPSHHR